MKKKFLIIRLSSLGDVVHTLPVLSKLRESFPDSRIDWLVGEKGIGLLEHIDGIDNVYKFNVDILWKLRSNKYDYVLDVQGLFKTALIGRIIGGKKLIGFKDTREYADIFYDEKINVGSLFNTNEHIVDLNLRLLSPIDGVNDTPIKFLIPKIDDVSVELAESLNLDKKKILILPATTWGSKMWKLEYWEELIKKLSCDSQVFISAAESDFPFIYSLLDRVSEVENCINLVGKTDLKSLMYLIQNVDLVIGLDSGATHLANAIQNDFKKPKVFGIYGPTSSFRNGLYSFIDNAIYNKSLDCLVCRKKTCPLDNHFCMESLMVDKVLDVAKA